MKRCMRQTVRYLRGSGKNATSRIGEQRADGRTHRERERFRMMENGVGGCAEEGGCGGGGGGGLRLKLR